MQSRIRVACLTLTIEEGYIDEFRIHPIIEQLRGYTKIFQIYFRTRGTVINTIVAKIFEDDGAITPPPSPPPPTTLDPITPDPKRSAAR